MARDSIVGKPLVDAAYRLLKQDKEMVPLLFVGGLASTIAFALIAGLGTFIDPSVVEENGSGIVAYTFYAVALLVSTSISILFLGAIVGAATQRAEGQDPTARTALAAAWERRWPLLAWAVTSTVVGIALRQLERFGPLGFIARLVGGVAWSVATVFAVPVIMAEGVMPFTAVRRSGRILTARFGTNARAGFRLGLQWIAAGIAAAVILVVGIVLVIGGFADHNAVLVVGGMLVTLVGFAALVTVSAIYSAVGAYLRTLLYRHATGLPIPGVDPSVLPPLTA